jgi:cobyrinic acid a,c-diamide synthase
MSQMPRIAVGTIQENVDRQPALWALYDLLERAEVRVQAFLPQSRFAKHDAATVITGQPYRHLDPWLMSRQTCREFFWHGTRTCDLAVVEGHFCCRSDSSSGLNWLADTLDAARIGIVDVRRVDGCGIRQRPAALHGLLLTGAPHDEVSRHQTLFESLWGVPVLGALAPAPEQERAIARLSAGEAPSRELCAALGRKLWLLSPERLLGLADQRRLPAFETRLFREGDELAGLNAAVACDAAFHSCFPETLDLMELHGANVRDFSPLADDGLPEDTNLVLVGSGRVDRFAEELAANHCLKHSLLAYVREGGRIYAEGGGVAWLGRQVVLDGGVHFPMSGVLPTIAFHDSSAEREPPGAELTLAGNGWLGEAGVRLRGYLDAPWRLGAVDSLVSLAREAERRSDLVGRAQVIGSRLTIHFAAQAEFLERLFRPAVEAGLPCRV